MFKSGLPLAAFLLVACGLVPIAGAQDWPQRAVKVILPFGPGGTSDNVVRTFAEKLSQALGQQFVVEYRSGAGGAIGIETVAKATPDGYTMGLSNLAALAVIPNGRKVAYDPFKDFAPVGRVADQIIGIATNLQVPANSLQELIALAKAKPGSLSYSSAGIGSATHFVGEILKQSAGIDLLHVPYRGGAEALVDVLAGHVQIQIEGIVFAQARAGKMRLHGVTTAKRYSEFPDVPAIVEVVPGFSFDNWFGFIFPTGVAPAAIERANAVLRAAAQSPDVAQRFLPVGLEPRVDTPADMLADMRRQSERYAKLMRDLDIKLE